MGFVFGDYFVIFWGVGVPSLVPSAVVQLGAPPGELR